MAQYGPSPQFQFNYPGVYSPGQMAFNNNTELSNLITMFSGPLLGAMAGPGNFMPHMMPTQQLVDQFALRNYQRQSQTAAYEIAPDNTGDVRDLLLGVRGMVTNDPATNLNREQAGNIASMINSPIAKGAIGMLMGPENAEALFHGTKGDVGALGAQLNRVGYFRRDPTGPGRMDAQSLADYSRGTFAHLYEPHGNLQDIENQSRSTDTAVRDAGRARLKKAARMEYADVVDDSAVADRLEQMDKAPERVAELYKKYVAGGKATDTKQQAQELVKFDRAIAASGVLKENEATVGGLMRRAERAPTEEMHGFMAGQVGKIAENMFQRGLMPTDIGRLSPADRARMINQTPLDTETMDRLSREMAKRDLSDKGNSSDKARQYRALTSDTEREEFVNRNAGDYKTTLEKTRKEIEKTATGASDAMSATDLEKLQGFDSLAGNVDAKRSAEAIKKYTGAVAAIRDIFGDNGNPNAPLPALLAALEGLTGGAVGSMKPQKIEATLRQMQTVAKEAGIGFDQMAAMSTQIDSMGQSLGLTPADTLRVKAASMTGVKVMQDTGAFSNPIYGQVDKGTAANDMSEYMTRGAASKNARAMAALESIYQTSEIDPTTGKSKRFAGTELEAALEAYRNNEGDGSYTDPVTGEKKNIRKLIGEFGEAGAVDILGKSGGTMGEFTAQANNPAVMQYSNEAFGFLTQKYEATRDISYGDTQSRLAEKLKGTAVMSGSFDEQSATLATLGDTLATMIVDTSDLSPNEQITKIQQNLESKFEAELSKTLPPEEAKRRAKEAAAIAGERSNLNEMIGGANTVYGYRTGGQTLSRMHQRSGDGRDTQIASEHSQTEKRAARRAETSFGFESTPLARMSDYLQDTARRGESFNFDEFIKSMAPVIGDSEVLNRYGRDMQGGFEELTALRRDAMITNTEVDELVKNKDEAALRKIAGTDAKTQIVADDEAIKLRDEAGQAAIADDAGLVQTYKQYVSNAGDIDASKLTDKQRSSMTQELRYNQKFLDAMEKKALGDDRISFSRLSQNARSNVGTAETGKEALANDIAKIEKSMLEGSNKDVLQEGVFATFRALGVTADDDKMAAIQAAVADSSEGGKKKLLDTIGTLGLGEEQTKKITGLLTAQQAGQSLDVGRTLGIDKITNREMERELTAHFVAQGMEATAAQQQAKETAAAVEQKKDDAAGAATPVTQQEKQTRLASELKEKSGGKMSDEAATAAASEIMKKTDAAVEAKTDAASGVQQRVDTLEINAQNVIIKGAKIDGGDEKTQPGSQPSTSETAAQETPAATPATPASDTSIAASTPADAALNGTPPDTSIEPKKDAPAATPAPLPTPPTPTPEKVAARNETQLKHDKGVDTPAAPQKPTEEQYIKMYGESVGKELWQREKAAAETPPPSMTDAINEAIQSPDGQAVLSGASALYNKYAPKFVKDAVSDAVPNYMEKKQRAEWMGDKDEKLASYAAESRPAPVNELGYELGTLIASEDTLTSINGHAVLNSRLQQDTPSEVTGSPLDQIMYALSKGEMPAQTFTEGAMVSSQRVIENDEMTAERLAPLPDELKEDAERYGAQKQETNADAKALKDVKKLDSNNAQTRLQKMYLHNRDRIAAAGDAQEKEDAEHDTKQSLNMLGVHNAARVAGIDTTKGIDYDERAQTINGVKVNKDEVDRHIRLVNEQAKENPYSVVDDDVLKHYGKTQQKKENITRRDEQLRQKADDELKRAHGLSSANVTPGEDKKQPETADIKPDAAAAQADTLANALPEERPVTTGVNAANRVHSLSATMPTGMPPAAASSGASGSSGAGGSSMTISGTLSLSGLQEAIISAQGSRVMQTEGGAPVVIDPTLQQGAPAAPKVFG